MGCCSTKKIIAVEFESLGWKTWTWKIATSYKTSKTSKGKENERYTVTLLEESLGNIGKNKKAAKYALYVIQCFQMILQVL